MNGIWRQIRTGAAALAVAVSLSFGATHAFAGPPTPPDEAARACNPRGCNAACQAQGGYEGRCNNGACLCLF